VRLPTLSDENISYVWDTSSKEEAGYSFLNLKMYGGFGSDILFHKSDSPLYPEQILLFFTIH